MPLPFLLLPPHRFCAALLGIAADAMCAPGRRLAAATFARNTLRKAWGAVAPEEEGDEAAAGVAYFPPASRATVRTAALNALIAAPTDARRLLADCLRLASTAARSSKTVPDASTFGADLVEDVVSASSSSSGGGGGGDSPSSSVVVVSPGYLLAVHAAARPFQYFRDPTVTREEAPPALERLCAEVIVPAVLPALLQQTTTTQRRRQSAEEASQEARIAFKIMFRLVRAYMPETLRPCLAKMCAAVHDTCVAACDAAMGEEVPAVTWIAVKRALRLAAALVSRHAATLTLYSGSEGNDDEGEMSLAKLASAARRVAGASSVSSSSSAPPAPAVAAAFSVLDAILSVSSDKGTSPAVAAATFAALAPNVNDKNNDKNNSAAKGGGPAVAALTVLVRECVMPHVCLTEADRETLTEDPEEYARQNAVGEAAADGAVEEALDASAGSGGGARRREPPSILSPPSPPPRPRRYSWFGGRRRGGSREGW